MLLKAHHERFRRNLRLSKMAPRTNVLVNDETVHGEPNVLPAHYRRNLRLWKKVRVSFGGRNYPSCCDARVGDEQRGVQQSERDGRGMMWIDDVGLLEQRGLYGGPSRQVGDGLQERWQRDNSLWLDPAVEE
jgi:hypothetical protein